MMKFFDSQKVKGVFIQVVMTGLDDLEPLHEDSKGWLWSPIESFDRSVITDYKMIGLTAEIDNEKAKDIVATKPYGSEPGFCTLDYGSEPDDKTKFWPGFCVGDETQFLRSFISLLMANDIECWSRNLNFPENKWIKVDEPKHYVLLIKSNE